MRGTRAAAGSQGHLNLAGADHRRPRGQIRGPCAAGHVACFRTCAGKQRSSSDADAFCARALFVVPIGMLADRFSVTRVLATCSLVSVGLIWALHMAWGQASLVYATLFVLGPVLMCFMRSASRSSVPVSPTTNLQRPTRSSSCCTAWADLAARSWSAGPWTPRAPSARSGPSQRWCCYCPCPWVWHGCALDDSGVASAQGVDAVRRATTPPDLTPASQPSCMAWHAGLWECARSCRLQFGVRLARERETALLLIRPSEV